MIKSNSIEKYEHKFEFASFNSYYLSCFLKITFIYIQTQLISFPTPAHPQTPSLFKKKFLQQPLFEQQILIRKNFSHQDILLLVQI